MLLSAQTPPSLRQTIEDHLTQVEACFAAELVSDLACVNALVTHIERYRGKMLRPMLVLLPGLAGAGDAGPVGAVGRDHQVIATVVEMVHMATLVHDDILDEAQVRRRGATINRLSGNETAVMLGDYLISHAYHLCSSLGQTQVSQIIAEATNTVCEGELLQLANRNNWSLDEATYFEIIERKTASLCGTCCRLGAMLSAMPATTCDAMDAYGRKVGIAFQIVDDLLDLVGDPLTVGKTLGRDLQKGKLTLPMIHYLRQSPATGQALIREIAACNEAGDTELDEALSRRIREQLEQHGSVAYAQHAAEQLVNDARLSLDSLPDNPARSLMQDMAQAVLTRKF